MEGWVKGCCQQLSEELTIATGESISRWYRDFHEGKDYDIKSGDDSDKIVVVERFSWSLRGRLLVKGSAVKSPMDAEFGDEGLTIRFKTWTVRKARDYKMVYRELFKTLDLMIQLSALATTAEEANEMKKEIALFEKLHFAKIEKQVEHLNAHRTAADIDTKFIKDS